MDDLAKKYYADSMATVAQFKTGVEALMQTAMEQLVHHQIEYDTQFIHRVKVMRGETVPTDAKDAEIDAKNAEIIRLREELAKKIAEFPAKLEDAEIDRLKNELEDVKILKAAPMSDADIEDRSGL